MDMTTRVSDQKLTGNLELMCPHVGIYVFVQLIIFPEPEAIGFSFRSHRIFPDTSEKYFSFERIPVYESWRFRFWLWIKCVSSL